MSTPTTNDPPPAYEEVKNVENAVLESFLTPEVQVQFKLQIEEITTHTQMLAERFRTVKDKLEEIDTHKFDEPLAPTWIGLRDRYLQYIQSSEIVAAEIATAANKYLTFVVKPAAGYHQKGEISAEELEDLNVEIQDLLTSNAKNEKDALELRAKFASLISDVKTFRDKIVSGKFGESRISANEQKRAELDGKLTILQAELDGINASLEKAQKALLYGGIAAGVLVTFTAWCPVVAVAIFAAGVLNAVGSGVAVAVYQSKAANKSKEISDVKAERKRIQDEIDLITSIRSSLKSLGDHELDDVINGLEFFRAIWAAIAVDCQTIGIYMKDVQSRKKLMEDKKRMTAPASLVQYLRNSTTLYYGLSRGLYLYAMGLKEARNTGDLST